MVVRALPDGSDARVFRHHTAPSPGPDPEAAHGPQVFQACDDALDYAESNLGADGNSADDQVCPHHPRARPSRVPSGTGRTAQAVVGAGERR